MTLPLELPASQWISYDLTPKGLTELPAAGMELLLWTVEDYWDAEVHIIRGAVHMGETRAEGDGRYLIDYMDTEHSIVTHWMPLPAPPSEQAELRTLPGCARVAEGEPSCASYCGRNSMHQPACATSFSSGTPGVPDVSQPNVKELLQRFERQAQRFGELWERCQGKGWPDAESDEFTAIRDERLPALRRAIEDACGVQPTGEDHGA